MTRVINIWPVSISASVWCSRSHVSDAFFDPFSTEGSSLPKLFSKDGGATWYIVTSFLSPPCNRMCISQKVRSFTNVPRKANCVISYFDCILQRKELVVFS